VSGRETAWRVLADELVSSREEERGEGDRAATYLITPLGARANRVLLAGHLDPPEAAGRDGTPSFFRARFTDPTGTLTITAGSFQPRALTALRGITEGANAIVVGKPHRYEGRDGAVSISVRAESLRPASEDEVQALRWEAAHQTLRRITLARRVRKNAAVSDDALRAEGYSGLWVAGARAAQWRYPNADLDRALAPIERLAGVSPPRASAAAPPAPEPTRPRPTAPRAPPKPADHAQESIFLDLVDQLVEVSDDGFADLKEAERRAAAQGLTSERVEELLGQLEADGVLEEPIVGKLRRA
jgi:uncharacterized protein